MAERMKLSVNTGAIVIDVENEVGEKLGEFTLNPTDTGILSRRERMAAFLAGVTLPEGQAEAERMEGIKRLDAAIMEQFNLLLAYDVSDGIFGRCAPLTLLKNGEFYYQNVLRGIDGLITKAMEKRVADKLKKVDRATAKYHK